MEPYEGTNPYVFVSYAHLDNEIVEKCIRRLQQNLCYVWYDKGNHAGDEWAENIANHLINCECVLLFISSNSLRSNNVDNELTMALNHQKRVIPFFIEDINLPPKWEIKIGNLHMVKLKIKDDKIDPDELLRELPREVFKKYGSPFYKNDRHSFYITIEPVYSRYGTPYDKKLNFICETDGEQKIIWSYFATNYYELIPDKRTDENGQTIIKVNVLSQVEDDFFDMKQNGPIIFTVQLSLWVIYPFSGEEGNGIMIFALVDPRGADPKIVLLDSMISHDSFGDIKSYEYDPLNTSDASIMRTLPKYKDNDKCMK